MTHTVCLTWIHPCAVATIHYPLSQERAGTGARHSKRERVRKRKSVRKFAAAKDHLGLPLLTSADCLLLTSADSLLQTVRLPGIKLRKGVDRSVIRYDMRCARTRTHVMRPRVTVKGRRPPSQIRHHPGRRCGTGVWHRGLALGYGTGIWHRGMAQG